MKPVIALVGRPNVGKSTLFNKLTRSKDALVADFPGLTRDRQYGSGRLGAFAYLVIDTGGLSGASDSLDRRMEYQTELAIDEADVVLFIVDARNGLTPVDQQIAERLRRSDREVLLVVNKVDGIGESQSQMDFFGLGFGEPIPIAAVQNRGLLALMNTVQSRIPESTAVEIEQDVHSITIALVGRPNVGKSTLINRLVGAERVVTFDQPGTTRDAISVPFQRSGKQYCLIDTAGVRRRGRVSEVVEKFSIVKTLQAIDQCHVGVLLIDAHDSVTDQDLHLLGYMIDQGRAVVVAVNKWDDVTGEAREAIKADLERRVSFLRFSRIHFISALRGSGVSDLFKSINRAHASAFVDMATPRLTRMLEYAVEQHQPPLVNGRRIKLRYAHQGGVNPPIIVIHGNQASRVPVDYQRYLANFFQGELSLFGTPLRLEFRQGKNPFAATRGAHPAKPTERQRKKKATRQRR